MDMDWRNPLDEFTLRFLITQLTNDRESYIRMAREVKTLMKAGEDSSAEEAFLIRAEECGRIVHQLRRQLERMTAPSVPPPEPMPVPRHHPLDSDPRDPRHKKW